MYILHLIMKECCKHSVFVEENNRLEAIPTAIAHLKQETGGLSAEVIVCNSENMPIEFHTIIGSDGIPIKDENPWLWMALGILLSAMILPWYLS
jgi:hypothetical protein|tara:strand:+ start:267 stop:548 length:282 start_codon:yes stop_codon:yes gene_type:complete